MSVQHGYQPGQITKVLSVLPIMVCYLAHSSLLLICAIYLLLAPMYLWK